MHINVPFYLINGLFKIESAFLLNNNWYETNTLLIKAFYNTHY